MILLTRLNSRVFFDKILFFPSKRIRRESAYENKYNKEEERERKKKKCF